jgi:hypothetical protein
MELRKELEKLNALKSIDTEKFEAQYLSIKERFTSPDDIQQIDEYVGKLLSESAEKIDAFIDESVKNQLEKVSQIISLSYISRQYFNKTRTWLYQKVNGSAVNGKPARFTPEEISTLNFALKDISKQIGSTVITL